MVAKPTMPIVTEVEKLVVPLRGNSKGIFEEGDDDQEPANSWYISAPHQFRVLISTSLLFVSSFPPPHNKKEAARKNVRLDGFRDRVQPIFNFTRLLPYRIQRTRIIGRFRLHIAISSTDTESIRLRRRTAEVVTGRSSDLGHVERGGGVRHTAVGLAGVLGLLTGSSRQYYVREDYNNKKLNIKWEVA